MNKKIAGELAIGLILLLAIVVGGFFWLDSAKQIKESEQASQSRELFNKQTETKVEVAGNDNAKDVAEQSKAADACTPHYYEGEVAISGWLVPSDQDGSQALIVRIKSADVKNLPVKDSEVAGNFTVKLVDPTEKTKKDLSAASEDKPVSLTIRGFAEICQQPPLVSIEQATVAFKKS